MGMEFGSMKRKQLQALCKKHGVPANLTNLEMADRLSSILKIDEPDARKQSDASNLVGYESKIDAKEEPRNGKKVRFSPNNETFIFISSNVKTSAKQKQTTRSRLAKEASLKRIDSLIKSTRSRAQNLAKKVVVMDVSPMLEAKRTRRSKSHNVTESAGNNQGKSDGTVDVEDRQPPRASRRWQLRSQVAAFEQAHLGGTENMVPKKRAEQGPFKRNKITKDSARHFVAPSKTDNSSEACQRDRERRLRKKLEPLKKKDVGLAALDKKSEEIKISGRVTRTRSRMIHETSLVVATISEVESQGETGLVQQQEVPEKAVPGNFKKPRTVRKNLQIETLVSSNRQGEDAGQGKSKGMKSDEEGRSSSVLSMESVNSQTVEPTVDPANKAPPRRSTRKPQLAEVLADENSPVDTVDRMNMQQKQEDASNVVQLDPAENSSETVRKKQETGSGAFLSEEVSSIALPSEVRSSFPDGFDHVEKLEMKDHGEHSEENINREKSEGPKTVSNGGCVNQKIQEFSSHVVVGSEELNSYSEDCERDFCTNLHNQSSQPQETLDRSSARLSSFDKGFEAEQFSMMKNDCPRGITEHDHQDDWNHSRVSERGLLTPADEVDNRHPYEEEQNYSCEDTQPQARNSALQTEASRVDVEYHLDIQLKAASPKAVAETHIVEKACGSGSQNKHPTSVSVSQRNFEGPELDLGGLEMLEEALCIERDGDGLLSEKYNQITISEAIDKQSTNQDTALAVGPLVAVLHMDASNDCLQNLSSGRDSVAPKQCDALSSRQQDGHPQGSDYASNKISTDIRNELVLDVTGAAEGKIIDTTDCQGTPRLMESKSSDERKALDENKEDSGTRSLDLHFHQGETDGRSFLTPQTVPDACLNQGSVISEEMSDPSSFGICGLFDHIVGGGNAEACGDDHPEKVAADVPRHSMSPTEASIDLQKHPGTKNEDDVNCSDGLSGGHCGDAPSVNDVLPCSNIEPCGDYHQEEVVSDANIETFSQTETSIDRQKNTPGNFEEFSANVQSLGSMMVKTDQRCLNQKKLNNSGLEDMKKRKHDQINLEADLDGSDQGLSSMEASRDHISQVQTAFSGLPHSNAEKLSSKARKSVRLPEQDIHGYVGNTPQASLEGSFEADKALEILGIGKYKLRMATLEQDAKISKDELTITSPSAPKSSKAKSFTGQDIRNITNLVNEKLERSEFSKRITGFLEDFVDSAFQMDQNASSPVVESEAKLTSPATLLEDIQGSICSGVGVAAVEDVQWLERALLDDTYNCKVKCTDSSGSATLHEVMEKAHGISVQENAGIATIQNALVFAAAASQHGMNASRPMDEKTEKPSNARTDLELGLEENKGFAAEDLYPLFGGEEPKCDLTVQNLSSNAGQKIEEESVESKILEFPKTEEENEVGMENQSIFPRVEWKSDDAKEANEDNGSSLSAYEVQASHLMVKSRSPHTRVCCSPVLSLANAAIQDYKSSDVQVEDPTLICERSPLPGDSPMLDEASNTSTDDKNVRFESENVMEMSIQQLKVQEAPGAEALAKTGDEDVDVSWEPNFKDAESAEEEFKEDLVETVCSSGVEHEDVDIAEFVAEKHTFVDDFHAENIIKGLMNDQEAASAMIQEYIDREEEDKTRTINSSFGHNDDVVFPYSEADYQPASVLFSENRDIVSADVVQDTRTEQLQVHITNSKQHNPSSKQTGMTGITETPKRMAPRVSGMKENTGGIKTMRAPTTVSKTRTKRRALEVLPNK